MRTEWYVQTSIENFATYAQSFRQKVFLKWDNTLLHDDDGVKSARNEIG